MSGYTYGYISTYITNVCIYMIVFSLVDLYQKSIFPDVVKLLCIIVYVTLLKTGLFKLMDSKEALK